MLPKVVLLTAGHITQFLLRVVSLTLF